MSSDIAKGSAMLQAVGISPGQWLQRLQSTTALAAAIHDVGKANSLFQPMIHGLERTKQSVRHEWISVWIAMQRDVKQWLLPAVEGCEMCWHVAMYAVSGHHPKQDRAAPSSRCFREEAGKIEVYVDHKDFKACLEQISKCLDLSSESLECLRVDAVLHRGAGDRDSWKSFHGMVRSLEDFWDENFQNEADYWRPFYRLAQ